MCHNPYRGLCIILLAYLSLALAYGVILPPFENLDELEHFEVIRYVAENRRLPVYEVLDVEDYQMHQEISQPPLYYLFSAILVRLFGLRAEDASTFWQWNPRVACGLEAPHLYDNRAVLRHDPHSEAFPWQGALLTLHVLRLFSTCLQAITVIGAFALGRRLFPGRPAIPLLGAAFVAFNPQFLLVASGVNNDNLMTPLATVILWLVARVWQDRRLDWPRAVLLGVLCGAAGLSKLSGWLTLIPCAALFLALWLRHAAPRPALTLRAILIPITALALGSWWFWRNWQLYADPTALQPMLAVVGSRGWSSPWKGLLEAGLMFRSFWGQLPCAFYPSGFYLLYGLLTGLSAVGLFWGWRRLRSSERYMLITLVGWFVVIMLSWLRWNSMTPAPGGRLLFPALPAVALVMAAGLTRLASPRRVAQGVVFVLVLFAWWTEGHILPAFFALPHRIAVADPAYPLNATFSDTILLQGYDLVMDERAQRMQVTFYWEAAAPLNEDYLVALQLVSPIPGDTTQRWTYDSWPGRGNYPTGAWQTGIVIVDRYQFDLPAADFATQAWDLHLALYQRESGARLPVSIDGISVGTHLMLTRLRLPGVAPDCPAETRLPGTFDFGESVRLTHAVVAPSADHMLVTLCWESVRALPADYTVFVHLLDADGTLKTTGDGPPAAGAFPTSFWQSGDRILDTHWLPQPAAPGGTIVVGLYLPSDGARLSAWRDGEPVPDDALMIWPLSP
ncbi:MAG: glycosyltransferase family 39 protein [Anaerolineae bacterium]|nr:glycosyltransferase family 39 protein [Anaerolineae bacterium]